MAGRLDTTPKGDSTRGLGSVRRGRGPTLSAKTGWRLLVVPAMLWIGVAYLYPIFRILTLSFTEFTPPESGGLDNYEWFFSTPANVVVLQRTFWISGLIAGLCLLVGYPYAYLMTLTTGWRRLAMLSAVVIPLTISPLVRNFAWIGLLHTNGPLVGLLKGIGFEDPELLGNLIGVAIGMVHINFPLMVLPLYAALLRLDRQLLDAGASLGARPLTAFMRIYLPLSLPGVLAGTVLVFVRSLGFYLTPALLGSPRETLLSPLIITQTQLVLAWGRGGTMAMVLLVSTLGLLALGAAGARRALARGSS